jgi:hypothetical protein
MTLQPILLVSEKNLIFFFINAGCHADQALDTGQHRGDIQIIDMIRGHLS